MNTQTKPFAEACERNKDPIFNVLKRNLFGTERILEIGSGTGQHAVYFAQMLPTIDWQTSDCIENHAGICSWIEDSQLTNVHQPLSLNVIEDVWPAKSFDAAYSANTAHIMPWHAVEATFEGLANVLKPEARYFLYGPFNYNGQYTSDSNAQFDIWLKHQASHQAIRDFEAVEALANRCGFELLEDVEMPANNRILIWQKQ